MATAILSTHPETEARCRGCKRILPLSRFHRDPRSRLGITSRCRECLNRRFREKYKAAGGRTLKPNVFYKCEVCGIDVAKYVSPAAIPRNALRFCNRVCKGKGMGGLTRAEWRDTNRATDVSHTGRQREPQPDSNVDRWAPCRFCGTPFYHRFKNRQFCSDICRSRHGLKIRDKAKAVAYCRSYRAKHKEKFKNIYRRAFYRHRAKKLEARDRYRARKLNAPIYDLTEAQWRAIKAAHDYRCKYCGEVKPLTKDHVIPLSRGGAHTASNIVPACKSCNSKKWTKTPEEFADA